MQLTIYNLLLSLAAPLVRGWLRRHPKHEPLLARFNPPIPPVGPGGIWVHVCSLGEANGAMPLVEGLREAFPHRSVFITASTQAGLERCITLYGEEVVTWFPFDTRPAVRGFIAALTPAALVLFETELWPNVLAECRHASIPVLLANGRLSDKHHHRYRRMRWWYGPLIQHIEGACMQDELFAERMNELGLPAERIQVTGSIKFDAVRDAVSARERSRLRREWGFRENEAILLFASTRPGDEALASACWATLREEDPSLKLIIAPRHLDRLDDVLAPFSEPVVRRTELRNRNRPESARVFVLDTLGELGTLYALARVVVIGGSFYPDVNGHNPLEAAALGIPTIFGPYMSNFAQAEKVLVAAGGSVQVGCPEDLYLALSTLLADPRRQRQMGTAARRAVMANRGAVEKTIAQVRSAIEGEG